MSQAETAIPQAPHEVPESAIDTILHADGDNVIIERRADVAPIIKEIKEIKDVTDGVSKSGELYHVARIPMIVVEQYCNLRGISLHDWMVDSAHTVALLNDPDYAHLRIWEGRL